MSKRINLNTFKLWNLTKNKWKNILNTFTCVNLGKLLGPSVL